MCVVINLGDLDFSVTIRASATQIVGFVIDILIPWGTGGRESRASADCRRLLTTQSDRGSRFLDNAEMLQLCIVPPLGDFQVTMRSYLSMTYPDLIFNRQY